MAIKTFTAPLPASKSDGVTNIIDNIFTSTINTPQRTSGAIVRFPAALPGPSISEKWSLVSLSITGYLRWINGVGGGNPVTGFGKFGKMGAAIDPFHETTTTQNHLGGGGPWDFPIQTLPADQSLAVTLWDPDVNDLPPAYKYNDPNPPSDLSQTLPVTGVVTPPNPIPLYAGLQPGIVMWFTPSLLGVTAHSVDGGFGTYIGIMMISGSYNINYDDGT